MVEQNQLAELRVAAGFLQDRIEFLRQAGISFHGARDLYEILGYARTITNKQYRDRYSRGGIAGRIIDTYPKATWEGEMQIVEDEKPEVDTPFEIAWESMRDRLNIQGIFRKVDILSQLSTYAVLLIGAPGDFSQEMSKVNGPDNLLYLQPFSGGGGPFAPVHSSDAGANYVDATIQSWEKDATNPRFGQPTSYQLKRLDIQSPQLTRPVHWSRILHIAEGTLDNDVYGEPGLERVWNLLDDLDKIIGGGSEAFYQRANQGLHVNIAKDATFSPEDLTKMQEAVDEYKHNQTRILRTREVEVTPLGSEVADFSGPADAVVTQISGAKSIPKRILTGSEMGELASTQDAGNFKSQVSSRQRNHAGPNIVKKFVDRMIYYGFLPKPSIPYQVIWPDQEILSEPEKAQGALTWAMTNKAQGETVFTSSEIRDTWQKLKPLDPKDIKPIGVAPVDPNAKPDEVVTKNTPVPFGKKKPA